MLATNSEGGMLALLGGGAVYTWARLGRSKSFGLGLALIGLACVVMVTAAKVNDEGSFGLRLVMYRTALADIQAAPIWGHGAHTFQSFRETGSPLSDSEHNLALTLARETGLAGLLVVGWLVFRATRLQKFSALSLAFIGAFVIHSMVDGPLYANFLGAIGLFLVLGGSDERH
jgi:O-antigen ligase